MADQTWSQERANPQYPVIPMELLILVSLEMVDLLHLREMEQITGCGKSLKQIVNEIKH